MANDRNWDKEMAKIDRLMAKQGVSPDGDEPPTPQPPAKTKAQQSPAKQSIKAAPVPTKPEPSGKAVVQAPTGGTFGLWLIATLGPVGAAALFFWPYSKGCGAGLAVYLVGVLAVLAASIWTLRSAWENRRGKMMTVGLLTLLTALALTATEVLPRIGYSAVSLTWTCST